MYPCSTLHIRVTALGTCNRPSISIPQVLSLPVASLHDSDSGDQHLHHPVHVHGADVGEGCCEGLWDPEEPEHPAKEGNGPPATATTARAATGQTGGAASQGVDIQTTTGENGHIEYVDILVSRFAVKFKVLPPAWHASLPYYYPLADSAGHLTTLLYL